MPQRHVTIYCSECDWYGGDSMHTSIERLSDPDESINFCPRCGQRVVKHVYYIGFGSVKPIVIRVKPKE